MSETRKKYKRVGTPSRLNSGVKAAHCSSSSAWSFDAPE
jgi:hypothetical protein